MKSHYINELPIELREAIQPLLQKQIDSAPALKAFLRETAYGETGTAQSWIAYELKLRNPWEHYYSIRLFVHYAYYSNEFSLSLNKSLLMLKKQDGTYKVVQLEDNHLKQLRPLFTNTTTQRQISTCWESKKILDPSVWSGLSIYQTASHITSFYALQSFGLAKSLYEEIEKSKG